MFTRSELLKTLEVLDCIETEKDKFSHWQRDLFAKIRAEIYEKLAVAPVEKTEIPF
jgi:hypothetical protein